MKANRFFMTCAATLSLTACGGGTELTTTLSAAAERPTEFAAALLGAAEKPTSVQTPASGQVTVSVAGDRLTLSGTFRDLTANATAAHIHGPADENSTGPVLCTLVVPAATSGAFSAGQGPGTCGDAVLTAANLDDIKNGKLYVNVHTSINPNGEIRGQLRLKNQSTGSGSATVTVDGNKLKISGSFTGLSGSATSAHIHGPADENSSGAVFCTLAVPTAPSGEITAGTGKDSCGDITLSDADVTNFEGGKMYVNIHTDANPNGEVRGQLQLKK